MSPLYRYCCLQLAALRLCRIHQFYFKNIKLNQQTKQYGGYFTGANAKPLPSSMDFNAISSQSESEDIPDSGIATTSSRANFKNGYERRKIKATTTTFPSFGSLEQLQFEAALDFNDDNDSEGDVEMFLRQAVHNIDGEDQFNDVDDDDDDDDYGEIDIDYHPPRTAKDDAKMRGRATRTKKGTAGRENNRRVKSAGAGRAGASTQPAEECEEAVETSNKMQTRSKGKRGRKGSANAQTVNVNDNAADGLDLNLNEY